MWTPRIVVNNQEVLAEGSIVSFGNETIDFYPIPGNIYLVKLIFQQRAGENPTINWRPEPPSMFIITFTNCDAQSTLANATPIHVANHNNRKILLNIALQYVGALNTGNRIVHYTFIDGGPT